MSDKPKIVVHRDPSEGHTYTVSVRGRVVAEGWTAGSRADARREAEYEARQLMAREAVA